MENTDARTKEDCNRILDEQTIYLQKINTEIQEYTSKLNNLRFECENLEKEIEVLSKERELHESHVVKTVSKMNNRSLQETCRSYICSIRLYCQLLDIELPDPKKEFKD
ncbi:19591_t:CDS:2 [Dentiscutata erythropus]|uniref:19591_t:CDS:1 n=1 Tax=Dentiscutata erythropus TaxID=1348616 RepID=A0A9N9CJ01_9GLOM|nr:19591_t:CDS:2 [Dentiscutata erythropus]